MTRYFKNPFRNLWRLKNKYDASNADAAARRALEPVINFCRIEKRA
jgi:hypothetical protein